MTVVPIGFRRQPPRVVVNNRRLSELVDEVLACMQQTNDPPVVFERGGALVVVRAGSALARPLDAAGLRIVLDRWIDFTWASEGKKKERPARPPHDVVESILADPPGPEVTPPLRGIVAHPVLTSDGRLLAADGYDRASGLLVRLGGLEGLRLDVPVDEALGLLLVELLGDFPFASDAARAHALSLLLEPFLRPAVAGPAPLYLVDAPVRGSGKTLLASALAAVALGERPHVMVADCGNEELEKRITSTLLAGASWVLLDNVNALVSPALAAAVTATRWRGRRLGRSELLDLPVALTWAATGNRPRLSDEIARRVVPIELDPGVERPEERDGFRHPDLLAWVLDHRVELVSACCSIVAAWTAAGRPAGRRSFGMFEAWAATMGGLLEFCGVPGFLEGRSAYHDEAAAEVGEWRAFVTAWAEVHGTAAVGAAELLALARERGLLLDAWAGRNEPSAAKRLGRMLARQRGRIFGRWRIVSAHDPSRNAEAWRLEPAPVAPKPRAAAEAGGLVVAEADGPESPAAEGTPTAAEAEAALRLAAERLRSRRAGE